MKTTLLIIVCLLSNTIASRAAAVITPAADHLTSNEIATAVAVAGTNGSPWLIDGGQRGSGERSVQWIQLYFLTATNAPDLRRGSVTLLDRGMATNGGWIPWRVPGSNAVVNTPQWREFFQLAESGRGFTPVEAPHILSRISRLFGAFTDEELLSVVRFVRTNPSWIGPNGPEKLPGAVPIVSVSKGLGSALQKAFGATDDTVFVVLSTGDFTSAMAYLRPDAGSWRLVAIVHGMY